LKSFLGKAFFLQANKKIKDFFTPKNIEKIFFYDLTGLGE